MKRLRRLILLTTILSSFTLYAQDSIRVSLLTCDPGQDIYTLFGHTAIRLENFTTGDDTVYNYGLFSFDTPNFILKFLTGLTDYRLGKEPFDRFAFVYAMRGWSIHQQTLCLTSEEAALLQEKLEINYLPENRIYRYNYFYENCTTKARDIIESCVDGTIVYPDVYRGKTFRGIVHEFTAGSPWDELGIDLCFGADADVEIGERQQQFAPFYMKDYASRAYILSDDGTERILVTEESMAMETEPEEEWSGFPLSPLACSVLLLAATCCICLVELKKRRTYWLWEVVLMIGQGLAGCIVAFLFFFSVHPTVDSNWVMWMFNPLPLLYSPIAIFLALKRRKDRYHVVNVVWLTVFMIIMLSGVQYFNPSVVPLALTLLASSLTHVIVENVGAGRVLTRNRK